MKHSVAVIFSIGFLLQTLSVEAQILTGRILGLVRDESGALLPGTTATLESPALPGCPIASVTNERGEFRFTQLQPDLYLPRAYLTALFLALSLGFGPAIPSVTAQTATATTGAVSGIVTDSSNAIVPGVTVNLSGTSLIASQTTTTTDQAGAYWFSAVPPGDYTLTFALAGFGTVVRDGVRVGLGFTASVDVELRPGSVTDNVRVTGAPAIDLASTAVAVRFDSQTLATLPGTRDVFAVLGSTPGIALAKPNVGGSNAITLLEYTAYGLRAITGMNRNEVEGIRVGGANGASDNYISDFASFSEIAVKAVGNSAAMPAPGTLTQYVSKAGGNTYRGSAYADVEDGAWQATNIDDTQIARGVVGGPGLNPRDVNRLERFRDFSADVGGYLKKDRAWWYASYRDTEVRQRFTWLVDDTVAIKARIGTGKLSYVLWPGHALVGYMQHQRVAQSNFFFTGTSQPIQTNDALPRLEFPASVWKVEYNAAATSAVYIEARAGGYMTDAKLTFKTLAPRIADAGANTVSGGASALERHIRRPHFNGFISISKTGWIGSHTFRIGGEHMRDAIDAPFSGFGHSCNCVSTLNNGMPTQVQITLGNNVSKNDLITSAGYVEDTWRLARRVTLSLGLRLDRYQPGLPEQQGPAGQTFAALAPVITFNNWGPRLGLSADLTGDRKTVLKVHYGTFWLYPGTNFTAAINPNPSGWSRTYRWTDDANGNGRWDSGEESALVSVAGGSTATRLDPDISNTQVKQANVYVEREVARELAVRTGFVLNAKRDAYGTINVSRPLSAYSVPVPVVDPGPDGRPGTADDGATLTAFNLADAFLGPAPVNLTTNLPDSNSDYYTWEVTATKRPTGRWGLLASITKTWNHEAALGVGNDFTPNTLINTVDGQDHFTTWQAKLHATFRLPLDLLVVPVVRSQSGTPFARTFVHALNYGNATIKTGPVGTERTPTITLVDLRTEKAFSVGWARMMGFIDLYNLFNSNAEQTVTTSSGASWLRPTAITGPRILRIGARIEW